jgi:hypothetical protein
MSYGVTDDIQTVKGTFQLRKDIDIIGGIGNIAFRMPWIMHKIIQAQRHAEVSRAYGHGSNTFYKGSDIYSVSRLPKVFVRWIVDHGKKFFAKGGEEL